MTKTIEQHHKRSQMNTVLQRTQTDVHSMNTADTPTVYITSSRDRLMSTPTLKHVIYLPPLTLMHIKEERDQVDSL